MVGSLPNFQGHLKCSQVIFERLSHQGRAPQKGVSAKSISSQGFRAGGSCHTFSESGGLGEKNVGSGILIFGPQFEKTGPESMAGWGFTKILEFQHFS